MKVFKSCMALWLVGVLLLSFNCFGIDDRSMLVSGRMISDVSTMRRSLMSKNLKENSKCRSHGGIGDVSLEDYSGYDPSPSSKASVRIGPIEHGSPLIPYIPTPKPSPPSPPDDNGLL